MHRSSFKKKLGRKHPAIINVYDNRSFSDAGLLDKNKDLVIDKIRENRRSA